MDMMSLAEQVVAMEPLATFFFALAVVQTLANGPINAFANGTTSL